MSEGSWSNRKIVYFVEGDTEQKLLEVLKRDLRSIYSGKIRKRNMVQERLRASEFIQYGKKISVVLVFDTDTGYSEILKSNLECISGLNNIQEVICIPQVNNLEDELLYACGIRDIRELTNSRSRGDFKRDFLRLQNAGEVLKKAGFDVSRIWSREAAGVFADIKNGAGKIKKRC